jgi:hypothetical protein
MASIVLLKQLLLFVHMLLFAFALSEVVHADLRLLRSKKLDLDRIPSTARRLTALLALLWLTGIVLVLLAFGFDLSEFQSNDKLVAKILVVTVLTANGFLLHAIAFPMLRRSSWAAATVASALGAISTVSWLYASFVGVSRLIAPELNLADFTITYLSLLLGGLSISLLFVRPLLERKLGRSFAEKIGGVHRDATKYDRVAVPRPNSSPAQRSLP